MFNFGLPGSMCSEPAEADLNTPRREARFRGTTACIDHISAGFDSMKAGSMRPPLPPASTTIQHALPGASICPQWAGAGQND